MNPEKTAIMKRMKVLVFDDNEAHRYSAELLLGKEHDLTVVATYDGAQKLLLPDVTDVGEERALEVFAQKYGDKDLFRWKGISRELQKERHDFYYDEARKVRVYPFFDAVLTDLMVPASSQNQPPGNMLVGKEMPLGTTIALLALVAGVKMVAVVTDIDHHADPASAAFDCFGSHYNRKGGRIAGVKIVCTNDPRLIISLDAKTGEIISNEFLQTKEGKEKYPLDKTTWEHQGICRCKDWKSVLEALVAGRETVG
jgi:CheY-like chemotaxis protein